MGLGPAGRAKPHQDHVSAIEAPPERAEKANAHPLHEAVGSFLLTKRVGG